VSCTTIPCPTVEQCQSLTETFRWALDMAKTCDPDAESQCQVVATSAVQCGCPTYANDPNWVETLEGLVSGWKGVGCDGGLTCGMCPTPPIAGYCSSDGRCVDS
jgi:hypothetical protein